MATFGVTSTGGYGMLQNFSKSSSAEIAEARDENGLATDEQAYSRDIEYSSEGIFDGDTVLEAGAAITMGSETVLIRNVSENETNTGYKRVSVTAGVKDSATQVALAART